MKSLSLFLLFIAPLCAQTIDVTSYGAKPDGGTDATAAINKAFAAAGHGAEIVFPCGPHGTSYLVSEPLNFPSNVTIHGTHNLGCQIVFRSGSFHDYAFSFINTKTTTVRDLGLYTSSEGSHPDAILTLGGTHGSNGQNLLDNVGIGGFAEKVMMYSIASENNVFKHLYFDLMGGSASVGFYTSAKDNLGICSACETASNFSLVMDTPIFAINISTPFTAIEDKTESNTGDHVYRDGYIGSGENAQSAGFRFISGDSSHSGENGRVVVSGFRIENGGYAFLFARDSQAYIYNLDISSVTWDSSASHAVGFMQGAAGLTLADCQFAKNLGENHSPNATSSVEGMEDSVLMEDYGAVTIRSKAVNNYFMMTGRGKVNLPGSKSGNVVIQPGH